MQEMYCPNCGHHLVGHRTDRQLQGERAVQLEWMICTNCRHVGLRSWNFADGVLPSRPELPRDVHQEATKRRSV